MSDRTSKLSIVTVSYNDIVGLTKTLQSVANQVDITGAPVSREVFEQIVVVSGVTEFEINSVMEQFKKREINFIVNEDKGLYDAMNIGLTAAKGSAVLFLNGGDSFFDPNSLQNIVQNTKLDRIGLFRVMQEHGNCGYIRPGYNRLDRVETYSHQGFVAPIRNMKIPFDTKVKINADTLWMREYNKSFESDTHPYIIASFALGGVSNKPSWKSVKVRLETNGLRRGILELLKLLMLKVLGESTYYKNLAMRSQYDLAILDQSAKPKV